MLLLLLATSAGAPDVTAPEVDSATVNSAGTTVTLALDEVVTVSVGTGFSISLSGGAATLTYASGSGSSSLVFNSSRTIYSGETGTVSYVTVANGIQDAAGNDLDSFSGLTITNNSSQVLDTTAPTVSSRTIATNGNSITIGFSEAVQFGAGGNTGLTLTPTNGGATITLTYSSGTGTSSLVYATSRTASNTETFTLGYTQPGAGVRDSAGNLLASFSGQAVTNNSTVNGAPTDISISSTSVLVTGGANTVVGALGATDPDAGDTFTFTLVAGTGSTNNASFNISGSSLRANNPSLLGVGTYSVRVRATDSAANTFEEAITITVISTTRFIVCAPIQDTIGEIVVSPIVGQS